MNARNILLLYLFDEELHLVLQRFVNGKIVTYCDSFRNIFENQNEVFNFVLFPFPRFILGLPVIFELFRALFCSPLFSEKLYICLILI